MDQLHNFFIGNTATNYIEAGFSEREAQAMAWIADQKPAGKFYGTIAGSFVAFSWGHFHSRVFNSIGLKFNKCYTQLAILGVHFNEYRPSLLWVIMSHAVLDMEPTNSMRTICISTTTSSLPICHL